MSTKRLSPEATRVLIGAYHAPLVMITFDMWARNDEPLLSDPATLRIFKQPAPHNYYGNCSVITLVQKGILEVTSTITRYRYKFAGRKDGRPEPVPYQFPSTCRISPAGRRMADRLLSEARRGKNPRVAHILARENGPIKLRLTHGTSTRTNPVQG